MKNIIVTGGAGYIGSHTVVELINNGYNPIIIDNFINSDRKTIERIADIVGFEPQVHDIDCTNLVDLFNVIGKLSDIDGVIHFAALKSVNESIERPLSYYDNNIISLINIIRIMGLLKIKNLVFSSSCTVYGSPTDSIQVTEETPLQEPTSPYGRTKLICENIIHDSNKSGLINSVILRYFNPIGAHESGKIGELPIGVPANLIPYVTQTAMGIREKLTIFGKTYNTEDGTNIRDFIHVSDLANAHVKSLMYMVENSIDVSTFNVGTGKGHSVLEVVNAFEEVTGTNVNYEIGEKRDGDIEAIYANSDKIKNDMGWECKYSLDDALYHAWKWENNLNDYDRTNKKT